MAISSEQTLGEGIAVLCYAESVLTYDLDAFCLLPTEREGLITLAPIYEYAHNGYVYDYMLISSTKD